VQDEFEKPDDEIQTLENGDAIISGLLSIEDINERFDLKLDEPFYNTVGGFVFGQLGRRAEVGDEVPVDGHVLRVDRLDGLRIDRLLLSKATDAAHSDPEALPLQEIES
jgi:CBS domain containing-hemolysin-like protein